MLVKNWMSQPVIAIDTADTMEEAIRRMKMHRIRTLPVLHKGKLKGILTDRDLKRASASEATTLEIHELMYLLSSIKIKTIMTPDPITVFYDFTIEETAELLLINKISGVPVLNYENEMVGIITQSDLFRVIVSLTGVGKRGVQFAFELEDRPGSIKEVTDLIREHNGRMISILSSYENAPDGYRHVYVRIYGIDKPALKELIDTYSKQKILIYVVDHYRNERLIFKDEQ